MTVRLLSFENTKIVVYVLRKSYLTAQHRKLQKIARLLIRYRCFSKTLLNGYFSNDCVKPLKN